MASSGHRTSPVPVLWLYGPSGVRKSTIAWEIFTRLPAEKGRIGYLDLDQLGMCYAPPTPQNWAPEPPLDHGRHRLQVRTLNAVLPNFAAAGARGVVVSGVVDARRGPDADLLTNAALTTLRLRASPEERGGPLETGPEPSCARSSGSHASPRRTGPGLNSRHPLNGDSQRPR